MSPLEINASCSDMKGRGKTAILLQSLRQVTHFVKGLHALQHRLWGADPSSGPAATDTGKKPRLQAHLPLLGFYIINPGLQSTHRRCCGRGWVCLQLQGRFYLWMSLWSSAPSPTVSEFPKWCKMQKSNSKCYLRPIVPPIHTPSHGTTVLSQTYIFYFPHFFSVRPKSENKTVLSPLAQAILLLERREITERGR